MVELSQPVQCHWSTHEIAEPHNLCCANTSTHIWPPFATHFARIVKLVKDTARMQASTMHANTQ